jgi:hypothetical protein
MRSARWRGVYVSGEAKAPPGRAALAGCAHSGQNFAAGGSATPQPAQRVASGAAHSWQNFAPVALSVWQRGHVGMAGSLPQRRRLGLRR